METVLANTSKVLMQVKDGNSLMYLPLDKLMDNTGGTRTTTGNVQLRANPAQDNQNTLRRRSSREGGGR
jgi:membrane protease subunit HflK